MKSRGHFLALLAVLMMAPARAEPVVVTIGVPS